MPNGGVIESKCDIHETITVKGDLNIQTGSTEKKICGIEATGRVQNTAGRLEVSYIEAKDIYFEGNHIYLNPEGYLKAETMEFDKAACDVHAAAGSNALVEVTKNIHFMNDNDFNRTFSDNIYFKVDGSIDMNGQTNGGFTDADRTLYNSAADYIAKHGNPNGKLNAGNASGDPACGNAWTVGKGNDDNTGDDDDDDNNTEETEEYKLRIIAEDLSAGDHDEDFDFNDVVFDVKYDAQNAKIKLLAAGGTLPLYIAAKGGNVKVEVHEQFGEGTGVMVNTHAAGGKDDVEPVEFELGIGVEDAAEANEKIIITVLKNGEEQELTAEQGKPAAKIAVDTTFNWLEERTSIKEAYSNFQEWVNGTFESPKWW